MHNLERQKLFEAIAFFHKNTRKVGLVKLFKLLYFTDMLHFKETGRPVFGLVYKALPFGPVPTDLYAEFSHPAPDLAEAVSIQSPPKDAESTATPLTIITPSATIKTGFLTRREERIMSEVAEIFKDASADDMSQVSHADNGPWDLARKKSQTWNQVIDYMNSARIQMGSGKGLPKDLLRERHEEFESDKKHFS